MPARRPAPVNPDDVTRRLFIYPVNLTTAAGASLAAGGVGTVNVINDPSASTVFTHLGFVSDYPFLVQFTPSDLGGGLFNDAVNGETMLSLLDKAGQFPVPIRMRGVSTIRLDFTNLDPANVNEIYFSLIGYREYSKLALAGCR